jgi:hypothetical protein
MRIQFLLNSIRIFCLVFLIQSTVAKASTGIHKDSTDQTNSSKSHSVRFIFNLSPILSTFSKLG